MKRGTVFLCAALLAQLGTARAPAAPVFFGYITDTECGADHAPMIGRGKMGKTAGSCTRGCVAKGATYGFVDSRHRLYQLDDQEKPASFAGRRVRLTGRKKGDTIFVERIEAAE